MLPLFPKDTYWFAVIRIWEQHACPGAHCIHPVPGSYFFSHAVALLRGESLCLLESSSPLSPAFPESSVMQKRLKIALFHHCSQAHCQSTKDKSLVQMPRTLAALHLCLLCATMRYQVGIGHILLPFWANKCPFCHKQGFARGWTQEFSYLHGPVFATLSCAHALDISDGQCS